MSHFTVLTIVPASAVGDGVTLEMAIEGMMAPYSEELRWPEYKEHLSIDDIEAMANYYTLDLTNLTALAEKMTAWTSQNGGVDEQGLYKLSTWNKDSTWDWYEIGGRWAGRMQGKLTAKSGDLVWGDRFNLNPLASLEQEGNERVGLDDQGRATVILCDGGRKRALALAEMRDQAGEAKRRTFAQLRDIVNQHGPLPICLSSRHDEIDAMSKEDRDATIQEYWNHPAIKAMSDQHLFGFMQLPEEVFSSMDEQTEVERAKAGAIPGYATLTIDGWLSPGKMDWWGMSSDTPMTKGHYWEAANAAIDRAAEDDFIVYLDAHV